jgi:hypothetical protein
LDGEEMGNCWDIEISIGDFAASHHEIPTMKKEAYIQLIFA